MIPREDIDLPVRHLGKYELLSRIGEGGMATVYRARMHGPAHASRDVALKLIHPHLARLEDFVLMFLDEMRMAMALTHRNIVQTFDAGVVEGRYFMVMELVEGGSLRELLRRILGKEPIPLDVILFIGMEICSALDHAHNARSLSQDGPGGVVHRDVSPSNILLSTRAT